MNQNDLDQAFQHLKEEEPTINLDAVQLAAQVGQTRVLRRQIRRRRCVLASTLAAVFAVGILVLRPLGGSPHYPTESLTTGNHPKIKQLESTTAPLTDSKLSLTSIPWLDSPLDSPLPPHLRINPAPHRSAPIEKPLQFTQTTSVLKNRIAKLETLAWKQRESSLKEKLSRHLFEN